MRPIKTNHVALLQLLGSAPMWIGRRLAKLARQTAVSPQRHMLCQNEVETYGSIYLAQTGMTAFCTCNWHPSRLDRAISAAICTAARLSHSLRRMIGLPPSSADQLQTARRIKRNSAPALVAPVPPRSAHRVLSCPPNRHLAVDRDARSLGTSTAADIIGGPETARRAVTPF